MMPIEAMPALPENCAVRLIDMDTRVRGLLSVGEDGFVNIYLNARLSRDAQLRALRHELRHYERDDLYSDADIRSVERAADAPDARPTPEQAPPLTSVDGVRAESSAPFEAAGLRRIGRGLYLPRGENLARAAADVDEAARALREAARLFDVLQTPPRVPAERLDALVRGLCADDIAFIGLMPAGVRLPVVMQLCRGSGDTINGAIYYDAEGRVHDALFALELNGRQRLRISIDLRRRRGRLAAAAIGREADGRAEALYYGNPRQ